MMRLLIYGSTFLWQALQAHLIDATARHCTRIGGHTQQDRCEGCKGSLRCSGYMGGWQRLHTSELDSGT